jgi:DNA-directed RNA polymerase subunit K/omega
MHKAAERGFKGLEIARMDIPLGLINLEIIGSAKTV